MKNVIFFANLCLIFQVLTQYCWANTVNLNFVQGSQTVIVDTSQIVDSLTILIKVSSTEPTNVSYVITKPTDCSVSISSSIFSITTVVASTNPIYGAYVVKFKPKDVLDSTLVLNLFEVNSNTSNTFISTAIINFKLKPQKYFKTLSFSLGGSFDFTNNKVDIAVFFGDMRLFQYFDDKESCLFKIYETGFTHQRSLVDENFLGESYERKVILDELPNNLVNMRIDRGDLLVKTTTNITNIFIATLHELINYDLKDNNRWLWYLTLPKFELVHYDNTVTYDSSRVYEKFKFNNVSRDTLNFRTDKIGKVTSFTINDIVTSVGIGTDLALKKQSTPG